MTYATALEILEKAIKQKEIHQESDEKELMEMRSNVYSIEMNMQRRQQDIRDLNHAIAALRNALEPKE